MMEPLALRKRFQISLAVYGVSPPFTHFVVTKDLFMIYVAQQGGGATRAMRVMPHMMVLYRYASAAALRRSPVDCSLFCTRLLMFIHGYAR
jgi:hypothetical protein